MISYLLGAPGSGKTTIIPILRRLVPGWVVLDWDGLMGPAGELAGAPIPATRETWEPYGRLVRTVVDLVLPANTPARRVHPRRAVRLAGRAVAAVGLRRPRAAPSARGSR